MTMEKIINSLDGKVDFKPRGYREYLNTYGDVLLAPQNASSVQVAHCRNDTSRKFLRYGMQRMGN